VSISGQGHGKLVIKLRPRPRKIGCKIEENAMEN
jgi:hypothetical protein